MAYTALEQMRKMNKERYHVDVGPFEPALYGAGRTGSDLKSAALRFLHDRCEALRFSSEKTKEDYDKFIKYKSEITAYNETAANENGVQVRDLEDGSGEEIKEGTKYLAYYVGWCADESIFDSSFDNNDNPTAFAKILDASLGMIEGWNLGVEGMKLNGIREITIPGELAYGESREICGGKNKPLKFIVMAKASEDPLKTLAADLDTAYMRLQYAYYGMNYDDVVKNAE